LIPSRFVHSIPVDEGIVALYHSLKVKTIFVPSEFSKQFMRGEHQDARLEEAGLLVDSPLHDDEALEKLRKQLLARTSAVSVMYLVLTDQCNLACDYCFIENQLPLDVKRRFMSQEVATTAIDFFSRALQRHPSSWEQRKSIIFYGGEPLLNKATFKHAVEYIEKLKKRGTIPSSLRLSLVTNGTCVTEDIADFIKEHSINVAVSIDGDRAATDRHRHTTQGHPVFDKAYASVKRMQRKGINVGISCTINEETLRDPDHTINFIIKDVGTKGLGFNILYRDHSMELSKDYESKAAQFILRAFERFREVGIYENRIMRKVDAFTAQRIYPYDCAAGGGRQIVVPPDGDVGICHGYLGSRKHFVGSVFDDKLVVENTPTYALWKQRSPLTMPECEECPVIGICGGGCPCDAEGSQGSIWALDERFCKHAKLTLDWLLSDLWRHSNPTQHCQNNGT